MNLGGMGMKLAGVLATLLLFSVSGARAQSVSQGSYLLLPPAPNFFAAASPVPAALALSARPAPAPAPAPAPQSVQGVFPEQYWQVYAGFTYMRFYEVPGTVVNTAGFQGSMAYYFKDWLAAEGEVSGGTGTEPGRTDNFVFSGAGLRARYVPSRAYSVWLHGDGGVAYFAPKVPYGGPTAFAYQLGAGLDLNVNRHLGYRAEADFVGSFLFGTYQLSPRIAAGVVYTF
jgi:hypothetical protein